MGVSKYSVNHHPISIILSWIKAKEIAIPEIQRPFVWDSTKVRDLIDSLYQGYPVGYLIAWQNPAIRLKDRTTSTGKKILIDGQQRVTALMALNLTRKSRPDYRYSGNRNHKAPESAQRNEKCSLLPFVRIYGSSLVMAALLGREVINNDYKQTRITIAFHPREKWFEVSNPAIQKDNAWIPDISKLVKSDVNMFDLVKEYCRLNTGTDEREIFGTLTSGKSSEDNLIGLIELNSELDIETVTDIFIRINS
jgi:hypothetical protein